MEDFSITFPFTSIKIVGSGLIGTSIALALAQRGVQVNLVDQNPESEQLARSLMGNPDLPVPAQLTIIATPVSAIYEVLVAEFERNPQSLFIDIGGIKSELLQKVEEFPALSRRFCATHPMAGREFSGPSSAQADLFDGRAWILTPTSQLSDQDFLRIEVFVAALGATGYQISAAEHDIAIAGISHFPQLVSSILTANLAPLNDQALLLAGQGLRDVSRLGSSSGELWAPLLVANRERLLPVLRKFQDDLERIIEAISQQNDKEIRELFTISAQERGRIPGKHGAKVRNYTYLPIVIDDRPGQLAAIFDECALSEVNVEDLAIEHSPGQETGLITLALSESDAEKLHRDLVAKGWQAHQPRK